MAWRQPRCSGYSSRNRWKLGCIPRWAGKRQEWAACPCSLHPSLSSPHPNLSSLHPSLSFLYPSLSFLHPSLSSLRPSLSSPLQAAIQRWEQGCRLGGASSEMPMLRREGFAGNAVLRLNTSRGAGRGERTLPGFSHAWGSWCLLK